MLITEYTQKSYESCKEMWKVSSKWKVRGFYGNFTEKCKFIAPLEAELSHLV